MDLVRSTEHPSRVAYNIGMIKELSQGYISPSQVAEVEGLGLELALPPYLHSLLGLILEHRGKIYPCRV